MRELKFRAWHESDKCWYNPRFIEMNLLGQAILSHGIEQFEIIPASAIEQYTGLKDKNGKEIYEGDILNDGVGHIGEVLFNERIGAFVYEWGECGSMFIDLYTSDIEIIGNIHENPELLGGEE